jgi:hypothetical protein
MAKPDNIIVLSAHRRDYHVKNLLPKLGRRRGEILVPDFTTHGLVTLPHHRLPRKLQLEPLLDPS